MGHEHTDDSRSELTDYADEQLLGAIDGMDAEHPFSAIAFACASWLRTVKLQRKEQAEHRQRVRIATSRMVTSTQMTAGQRRSALPRTLGAIRNNIPSVSGSALTMTIGLKYNTVHVALIPPRAPTNPTVPQYDMRLESGESLRMPKSSHRQTLFFEATYEQVGIIRETLPEAFWEQSCPVALPERWEPILVEGLAMADTDKSILRALPVTAVFLDFHQYPSSAEIHNQIHIACQVRTFERPNGIPLALLRDPESFEELSKLGAQELATVGKAADDLAHVLYSLECMLSEMTMVRFTLRDEAGLGISNLLNKIQSTIADIHTRLPILSDLTITAAAYLTDFLALASVGGAMALFRASAEGPVSPGREAAERLALQAEKRARTVNAKARDRLRHQAPLQEDAAGGCRGDSHERWCSPEAQGGRLLLSALQIVKRSMAAPLGQRLPASITAATAMAAHRDGEPWCEPFAHSEAVQTADGHVVACVSAERLRHDAFAGQFGALTAAEAKSLLAQRSALAELRRMRVGRTLDMSDDLSIALSCTVQAAMAYAPTAEGVLANAAILCKVLAGNSDAASRFAPLANQLKACKLNGPAKFSLVYELAQANVEAEHAAANFIARGVTINHVMADVWASTRAWSTSDELYMNEASPVMTRSYEELGETFHQALVDTVSSQGGPSFFRSVCKKYFKHTRIRSDPPAVRVAPRVDPLSQLLDVAHAAAVYTPALSDDVRNTMSSGCRRAADFGFHNPKLKHEAEDEYTASHFPRTGSDPALHTNQFNVGLPITAMNMQVEPPGWTRFKHLCPKLTGGTRPNSPLFEVGTHPFLTIVVSAMSDVFVEAATAGNPRLAAVLKACPLPEQYQWPPPTSTSRSIWPVVTVIATPMTNDLRVDESCERHRDVRPPPMHHHRHPEDPHQILTT